MLFIICSSTLCKKLKRNTSAYNCDSPINLSKWSYNRRQNWGWGAGGGAYPPTFFRGGGGGISIAPPPPLSISFQRHCLQSVWKKESGIINHIKHIRKENVGQKMVFIIYILVYCISRKVHLLLKWSSYQTIYLTICLTGRTGDHWSHTELQKV